MNFLSGLFWKPTENCQLRLRKLEAEVKSLRQLTMALRAMVEIRDEGSGSWKIPERKDER